METLNRKLRSLELYLAAHPDCEENSECADRLSDVQELLTDYKILKENDFDSTIVEKGCHYLVKFKSGNYGEVWYNCHEQWMYEYRNVEDAIDKIYTPKTK